MPKNKPKRNSKLVYLAAVIILLALGIASYIYTHPLCKATIQACCMTTTKLYININGDCNDMKLKIIDQNGTVVQELSVRPGQNMLNITVLHEGKYLLELVSRSKVLDRKVVQTMAIQDAAAGLQFGFNMSVLKVKVTGIGLDYCSDIKKSRDLLYVKGIVLRIVYSNGTDKTLTFTGKWPINGIITIPINQTLYTQLPQAIYITIIDSENNKYVGIPVTFPR